MQDLSSLATDSMWVTSQEGGLMVHDNSKAFSAPGSRPVTPVPAPENQPDPTVDLGSPKPPTVGTAGGGYSPSPVSWKKVGNG